MTRLPPLVSATALLAAVGCGGSTSEDSALPSEASWEQAAGARLVVATVDGEPIYGDCVANYAGRDLSPGQALEACIDFELLAQEARRQGFADQQALDVRKTESVRRLIDEAFYAKLSAPEDVPIEDVRYIWDKGLKDFYNHTELRATFYCRAANADKTGRTPPGEPAERARKVADAIYAEVGDRSDLTQDTMQPICERIGAEVGGATINHGSYETTLRGRAVIPYADAAFAIANIGQVSPPTLTAWGWDVILLVGKKPAQAHSFEQATPLIREKLFEAPEFEPYRRDRFSKFLAKALAAVTVERFDERLGRSAPGPGPARR